MSTDVNKRRAARQKKARQKQLKILLIFFIILAIVTLIIMCFTVFFTVNKINVTGSKIYSKSDIVKASQITTDDSWFFVSEDEVEENIRTKLPFVDSVELKRDFPDKIQLIITDAKEHSYYFSNNKYYVLSDKGYILNEQKNIPENAFEIKTHGISGKPGQKAVYKNVAEQDLVNNLIQNLQVYNIEIDEIDVTSLLQIKLKIEGKYTVLLGKNEYIEEKIKHLSSMIDNITDEANVIDLSMWEPDKREGTTRKENK
ncbi:MAG: FtsQ-type POTRA domain-containing protein [Clostridia bacterium]|nr:FtsQ-type POTRA domain-containing protein [Clostridia bacterium]